MSPSTSAWEYMNVNSKQMFVWRVYKLLNPLLVALWVMQVPGFEKEQYVEYMKADISGSAVWTFI